MAYGSTDYCSVAELKAQLRVADTDDDAAAAVAITAASRAIDQSCNRQFGLTGSAVARLYTYSGLCIEGRAAVRVDDLQTTVGLVAAYDTTGNGTYSQAVVVGTDFDLYPWNAPADGVPWTHLVARPYSAAWFIPRWPQGVRLTANWGWSAVPTVVKQACLIQASRFFVRRDSAYGVAGSPDLGSEIRLLKQLDPDVSLMLSRVRRYWGAV